LATGVGWRSQNFFPNIPKKFSGYITFFPKYEKNFPHIPKFFSGYKNIPRNEKKFSGKLHKFKISKVPFGQKKAILKTFVKQEKGTLLPEKGHLVKLGVLAPSPRFPRP
jgi:hypothetical protein